MEILINRKMYMQQSFEEYQKTGNGKDAHHRYYAQFVTPWVLEIVSLSIGEARIKDSSDEYFNDIPLSRWDNLEVLLKPHILKALGESNASSYSEEQQKEMKERHQYCVSLSDYVCVAKAAARIIRGKL